MPVRIIGNPGTDVVTVPTIGTARAGDAATLFEIHRAAVMAGCAGAYSPQHMATWFAGRDPSIYGPWLEQGRIRVAEAGGRVLGFAGWLPGEITLLYVRPELGGSGIGGRLLGDVAALAAMGSDGPLVVVATLNAVPFYRRHGFHPVAEESFSRGDPPLSFPVVRMRRPG